MIPISIIIYKRHLLAFCSGSPAPLRSISSMTISFGNDNDIILYALENIITYATKNQYIFVARCVWWPASIIGLKEGLNIHFDKVGIRSEASQIPSTTHFSLGHVHSYMVSQINYTDITDSKIERQDCICRNCEEFLLESKGKRSDFPKKSQKLRRKDLAAKQVKASHMVVKTWKTKTKGIERSELHRRKAAA